MRRRVELAVRDLECDAHHAGGGLDPADAYRSILRINPSRAELDAIWQRAQDLGLLAWGAPPWWVVAGAVRRKEVPALEWVIGRRGATPGTISRYETVKLARVVEIGRAARRVLAAGDLDEHVRSRLERLVELGDCAQLALMQPNLYLVSEYARRWSRYREIEYEELIQEGLIGLLRAVRHFDRRSGVALSSVASHVVGGWVRDAAAQSIRVARGPDEPVP